MDAVPRLDPIVSLAVALAENPGSFAFFVGSGASRDAGIPTGAEVRLQAMAELYRLQERTDETPTAAALEKWFADSAHGSLSYSSILETLMPDAAVRRDYLAKHFGAAEPAETHTKLAELAARGVVRIFITTNFDRLLERALQQRGIEPVVVTSDFELERAPTREHADCFVIKAHGDYLQETIRNTDAELAELERGITQELQAIVDRYGVVVMGYSGADAAIGQILRRRKAHYGLYWVTRSEVAGPASSLIEATQGRVITRESSAGFLSDLTRRLEVYRAHPSGLTPATVNAEVISLLRSDDRVGLRELLKVERRTLVAMTADVVSEHHQVSSPTDAQATAVAGEVYAAVDRFRGALLPLIDHDSEHFHEEVEAIAALAGTQHITSGVTAWIEFPQWPAWLLVQSLGAFAVESRRFRALGALLREPVPSRPRFNSALGLLFPGDVARVVSTLTLKSVGITNRAAPWYDALVRSLGESELLRESYPEIADGGERTLRAVNDFGLLRTVYAGMTQDRTLAEWAMYWDGGQRIATQIRESVRAREDIARDVFDTDSEDFLARAEEYRRAGLEGAVPNGLAQSGAHLGSDG